MINWIKHNIWGLLPNTKPYQDPFHVDKEDNLVPNFNLDGIKLELNLVENQLENTRVIEKYLEDVNWNSYKLELAAVWLSKSDELEKSLAELS